MYYANPDERKFQFELEDCIIMCLGRITKMVQFKNTFSNFPVRLCKENRYSFKILHFRNIFKSYQYYSFYTVDNKQ